ncbi:hypothetical protein PENSUB_8591 [Penicillium subrubescens]|uniref:SGNH hydrolase-type esterase domain-containing protein n=1 Tax=Penicillium subrubescens TaxID=1316194 RepID=A0A1Q5TG49_9EURO|nr:hypothetical protein PENSUB_8591 [Penicillium subrubescens]
MRMNTLLDTLYTSIPNTTIILSTLLPNKKQPDRVLQISTQYRELVSLRRAQNDRIVLADMGSFIKESQLVDGTHPDDEGYRDMAAVWWAAIQQAVKEGFIEYAAGTGMDGRVSVSVEGELDGGDSVSDPVLPVYSTAAAAAAQTGVVKATVGIVLSVLA